VTIGEEKFLDSEVPTVTLNNGAVGGDVLNDVTTTSPTTPTTPPLIPPVTTPPGTPPVTTPPVTPPVTTPPLTPPVTTPPPPSPPGNGNGNGNGYGNQPPPVTTPPLTPPLTPPSTTPPATGTSCSMTVDLTSVTINACNNGGNNCGSANVKLSMVGAATGATISATTVPGHLAVSLVSQSGGVYTFRISARNNTRTTNTVTFTGTSCGTKDVSVKTQ
jgi:hypothetical protein